MVMPLSETHGSVTVRTMQVYLTNQNRKLKVNALLDDASMKKISMLMWQLNWAFKVNHRELQ